MMGECLCHCVCLHNATILNTDTVAHCVAVIMMGRCHCHCATVSVRVLTHKLSHSRTASHTVHTTVAHCVAVTLGVSASLPMCALTQGRRVSHTLCRHCVTHCHTECCDCASVTVYTMNSHNHRVSQQSHTVSQRWGVVCVTLCVSTTTR
jgi:hypothetical protein